VIVKWEISDVNIGRILASNRIKYSKGNTKITFMTKKSETTVNLLYSQFWIYSMQMTGSLSQTK